MLGLAGVTERDTSVAEFTVRTVEPDTPPDAAAIAVVPGDTDDASPRVAPEVLIVATLLLDELQTAVLVRFWVVLSE
jgi:hypothetical protein